MKNVIISKGPLGEVLEQELFKHKRSFLKTLECGELERADEILRMMPSMERPEFKLLKHRAFIDGYEEGFHAARKAAIETLDG